MTGLRRLRVEIPLIAIAVVAIGIAFIHSAAFDPSTGGFGHYGVTQAKWLAVALVGFAAALVVPYWKLERHVWLFYVVALALLVGVHFFGGGVVKGARSWYRIGASAKLQPSELAKIALIFAVAKTLKERRDVPSWRWFAAVAAVAAAPLASILKEPDLGTVLVFVPALLAMLFVAGAPARIFAGLFGTGIAGALAAYHFVLGEYQRKRIDVFLDPTLDPKGAGYHTLQSRIAVGAGGVWGAGYGQGAQTQLHLPEAQNDFIYAVVAEEGGLVTAGLLLALLLALLLVCLDVAWRTREPFGRLVATGIASIYAGQIFVNCGMTVGLTPVTGITLPFVSYGGSSLLSSFVALGIVANIAMHPRPDFGAPPDAERR